MTTPTQSRYWVFTENGGDAFDQPRWTTLPAGAVYLVYQHERAGRDHLQGYIELTRGQRLSWLKRNISSTAHFASRRGTQAQAIAYSKKDDTRVTGPWELGTPTESRQGERADLAELVERVRGGERIRSLIDTMPYTIARYTRFYDILTGVSRPTRSCPLSVDLFYGDTGLGKTRAVYTMYEDSPHFYRVNATQNNLWFDGYDLHKYCLIDDFAGAASHVSVSMLLQLLDRYPIQLQRKGGHVWWMPVHVIVTTNIHPWYWYKWENRENQYWALKRRFNNVLNFNEYDDNGYVGKEMADDWWDIPNVAAGYVGIQHQND